MLVGDLDDRAGADMLVRVVLDHDGRVEPFAELRDAGLEQALLVLGSVVLEVLG